MCIQRICKGRKMLKFFEIADKIVVIRVFGF